MWRNFFPKSTDQKQHVNKEQKVSRHMQTNKISTFKMNVLPQEGVKWSTWNKLVSLGLRLRRHYHLLTSGEVNISHETTTMVVWIYDGI